ncbi:MAG: h16 [Gammaproteobacteria bacterium]|jgi:acyl-CoA reductase-like NAD-dependent aldehyde dehydrogenase|nr:h16 [Gammaproteobacteria bacterium]
MTSIANPAHVIQQTPSARVFVRNPWTGLIDHEFTAADATVVQSQVSHLRVAQRRWHREGLEFRIDALTRWIEALARHRDAIVSALLADTGRLMLSRDEVDGLCGYTRARLEQARSLPFEKSGRSAGSPRVRFLQRLVPYGVVGIISPWNYPLILSFLDAVPALLAGAAVMIKPSEITPRFVTPVRESLNEVPALADVVGLVCGSGPTGEAVVDATDAVVFTGSVRNGRRVAERAARQLKPAFLELGGKDPAIVLPSADLEAASHSILRGALVNAGQACFATERVYAHSSVFRPLVERLTTLARALDINFPDPARGQIGPIISAAQVDTIRAHLDDARQRGATFVTGGELETHGGVWLRPTIVVGVTHEMLLMREESFAPIVPVMSVDSVEQAVQLANDSTYGLSASVYGSPAEAERVGAELEAGGIYVNDNDLVGEVGMAAEKMSFKSSGLGGSRYGPEGILRFGHKQSIVTIEDRAPGLDLFRG